MLASTFKKLIKGFKRNGGYLEKWLPSRIFEEQGIPQRPTVNYVSATESGIYSKSNELET